MAEPVCYIRGEFVPFSEARISPDDLGMLRGFAVYEGITSFDGIPFYFHEHWNRLESSAAALGLTLPLSESDAFSATKELVRKNAGAKRANIRVICSGGPAVGGIEYDPSRTLFYVTAEPMASLPESFYTNGAPLVTYAHKRFMPEYKTTEYITAVRLQQKRKAAGAVEILYVGDGNVLECATSNICIVKDDNVITPSEGVLDGITKQVAFTLSRDAGYNAEERRVSVKELAEADEIFNTSSFKDIVPIVRIDDHAAGGGTVGPVTKDLMRRFAAHIKSDSWR